MGVVEFLQEKKNLTSRPPASPNPIEEGPAHIHTTYKQEYSPSLS